MRGFIIFILIIMSAVYLTYNLIYAVYNLLDKSLKDIRLKVKSLFMNRTILGNLNGLFIVICRLPVYIIISSIIVGFMCVDKLRDLKSCSFKKVTTVEEALKIAIKFWKLDVIEAFYNEEQKELCVLVKDKGLYVNGALLDSEYIKGLSKELYLLNAYVIDNAKHYNSMKKCQGSKVIQH